MQATDKRKSNIELLRIVVMFLIVGHHYFIHGLVDSWDQEGCQIWLRGGGNQQTCLKPVFSRRRSWRCRFLHHYGIFQHSEGQYQGDKGNCTDGVLRNHIDRYVGDYVYRRNPYWLCNIAEFSHQADCDSCKWNVVVCPCLLIDLLYRSACKWNNSSASQKDNDHSPRTHVGVMVWIRESLHGAVIRLAKGNFLLYDRSIFAAAQENRGKAFLSRRYFGRPMAVRRGMCVA